jgi:hypothetical protein
MSFVPFVVFAGANLRISSGDISPRGIFGG